MQFLDLLAAIQGFGIRFTIFGVPFLFSFWTIVLAALLSFMAREYISKQMCEYPESSCTIAGIGAGLTVLLSVLAHEGFHGVAGWYIGLVTTGGGMSWWGAYVSFDKGVSMIPPSHEILIGLSGVAMNFFIALIATFFVWLLHESRLENAVQWVAILNYRLAFLNLLPIIGLDGSKVLDGILRPFLPAGVIGIILTATTVFLLPRFLGFGKRKAAPRYESMLEKL